MKINQFLSFALISLAACGGSEAPAPAEEKHEAHEEHKEEAKKEEPKAEEKKAEEAAPNIVTYEGDVAMVALEGTDQMKYNTSRIEVKAGSKVKLTLTHTGKMPAQSMGHNFVLLAQGTDIPTFAGAAATASDAGYIPADQTAAVLAHTTVVGGGESVTIEFDAPAAGEYDFICSFPGHYSLMNGKFVVTAAE